MSALLGVRLLLQLGVRSASSYQNLFRCRDAVIDLQTFELKNTGRHYFELEDLNGKEGRNDNEEMVFYEDIINKKWK